VPSGGLYPPSSQVKTKLLRHKGTVRNNYKDNLRCGIMTKRPLFARQEQSALQMRNQLSIAVTPDRDAQPIAAHDDDTYQSRITAWMTRNGVLLTRVALGLVFL